MVIKVTKLELVTKDMSVCGKKTGSSFSPMLGVQRAEETAVGRRNTRRAWYPNEKVFQGVGNDQPRQMWQPEATNELGGGPLDLKLRPPGKGLAGASVPEFGGGDCVSRTQTLERGRAGWCWCLSKAGSVSTNLHVGFSYCYRWALLQPGWNAAG